MRVRPFIVLIAAGTAIAGLSTACGESDPGGLGPAPTMFTTIDGVVRFMDTLPPYSWEDSVWVDSIPVPGVVVRVMEVFPPNPSRDDGRSIHVRIAKTTTGPNGEYHIEFTASCVGRTGYYLTIDSHGIVALPGHTGSPGNFPGECTVPNIRFDIWVLPD